MNGKINAIGLFVKDISNMVAFYRDIMGMKTEWNGGSYAEFSAGGVRFIMFGREDFKKHTGKNFGYPKGLNGTLELYFDYDTREEVNAEYQRLVDLGAVAVYPPTDESWGMRSAYVADPEGNLIEIGSFKK